MKKLIVLSLFLLSPLSAQEHETANDTTENRIIIESYLYCEAKSEYNTNMLEVKKYKDEAKLGGVLNTSDMYPWQRDAATALRKMKRIKDEFNKPTYSGRKYKLIGCNDKRIVNYNSDYYEVIEQFLRDQLELDQQ